MPDRITCFHGPDLPDFDDLLHIQFCTDLQVPSIHVVCALPTPQHRMWCVLPVDDVPMTGPRSFPSPFPPESPRPKLRIRHIHRSIGIDHRHVLPQGFPK